MSFMEVWTIRRKGSRSRISCCIGISASKMNTKKLTFHQLFTVRFNIFGPQPLLWKELCPCCENFNPRTESLKIGNIKHDNLFYLLTWWILQWIVDSPTKRWPSCFAMRILPFVLIQCSFLSKVARNIKIFSRFFLTLLKSYFLKLKVNFLRFKSKQICPVYYTCSWTLLKKLNATDL